MFINNNNNIRSLYAQFEHLRNTATINYSNSEYSSSIVNAVFRSSWATGIGNLRVRKKIQRFRRPFRSNRYHCADSRTHGIFIAARNARRYALLLTTSHFLGNRERAPEYQPATGGSAFSSYLLDGLPIAITALLSLLASFLPLLSQRHTSACAFRSAARNSCRDRHNCSELRRATLTVINYFT